MALLWRSRAIPRCSACLRSYELTALTDAFIQTAPASRQQIRGKKKLPKATHIPVRLLKDVDGYGAKGSLVPIVRGIMRDKWFPKSIATYVTSAEMKTLTIKSADLSRDFDYMSPKTQELQSEQGDQGRQSGLEAASAGDDTEKFAALAPLSAARSAELIEIFAPSRFDFYRQRIVEPKEESEEGAEKVEAEESPAQRRFVGSGAAAELLASRAEDLRSKKDEAAKAAAEWKSRAIYGSVTTQEVLIALRAEMVRNDEAARVVLHAGDIQFVDLPPIETDKDRVKHVGEFQVEIRARGSDSASRRPVRVLSQET